MQLIKNKIHIYVNGRLMREGMMCPEACLFSECLNWPVKYFPFLYKPCFFKLTCIKYSDTIECLFLVLWFVRKHLYQLLCFSVRNRFTFRGNRLGQR